MQRQLQYLYISVFIYICVDVGSIKRWPSSSTKPLRHRIDLSKNLPSTHVQLNRCNRYVMEVELLHCHLDKHDFFFNFFFNF